MMLEKWTSFSLNKSLTERSVAWCIERTQANRVKKCGRAARGARTCQHSRHLVAQTIHSGLVTLYPWQIARETCISVRGCTKTRCGTHLPEREGGCIVGGFQPAEDSLASLGLTDHSTADTWGNTAGSPPPPPHLALLHLPAFPLTQSTLTLAHTSATRFTFGAST